jgi:nitroimidazol reductase NimA-like FMN-containing flavoprotein (pyridoxamine 5'-phosphate oxidase superfamily)
MTTSEFEPTANTTVRYANRASYDRAEAYRVLDDGFVAHVGFATGDQPFVIPMVYGRDGDHLLLHGSVATRLMRALDKGAKVCITVTHVDGLVLARSHFHHSINYRSVVVLGTATRLRDDAAERAFDVIVDHVAPGRSAETRPTNDVERRQTMVLSVPIEEASVKVRTGPPIDDEADLGEGAESVWAGVLPLSIAPGAPIPDQYTADDLAVASSVSCWTRPGQAGV